MNAIFPFSLRKRPIWAINCLFLLILLGSCNEHLPTNSSASNKSQIAVAATKAPTPHHSNQVDKIPASCGAVQSSFLDRDGDLWFGTHEKGVFRYASGAFTNYSTSEGFYANTVSAIIQDDKGKMWFGTEKGLYKYDGQTFSNIPLPWVDTSSIWLDSVYPIVNPNEVSALLQDSKGGIWIGTNGAGAYLYDGKNFKSYLAEAGRVQSDQLYHNIIPSILEDDNGNIWFTSRTHGGVCKFDGEKMTHFTAKDGLSDDMLLSSFKDQNGNIWFGSLGNRKGGLDRYDGKTFTNYNQDHGLCNNNVDCIFQDKTGKIWLGSMRGRLCKYDGANFSPFLTAEGNGLHGIRSIIEDKDGNLWFGGRNSALWRFDGETLTSFSQ